MGRELRRVPMDFDWPLKKTWEGYLNPHYQFSEKCPFCDGSGQNAATKKISDDWYDFADTGARWCNNLEQEDVQALVDDGRLMDFTHTWTNEKRWQPKDPPVVPTAAEVNEWSRTGIGHDAINQWICVKAKAKRLGVYGDCEFCKGEGVLWLTPEHHAAYEAWEQTEPPKGEGYQLWETTSEGSPTSPVFSSLRELCEWAAVNATTFGRFTATADEWESMLGDGIVTHTEGKMVFL